MHIQLKKIMTIPCLTLSLFATPWATADNTPVTATINLRSGDAINDVEIRAISNGVALLKGPYGTLQVPLQDVANVVFPGGDASQPGVVLDTGGYNAELKEMKNDNWSFSLRDVDGGFTLPSAARLRSINLEKAGASSTAASSTPLSSKGCNVKEWTYAYEPFGNSNWNFKIEKLAAIGPELVLQAQGSSRDGRVRRAGCVITCKTVDEKGRESTELVNDRARVDIKPAGINVRCPLPADDTQSFTLYLRTGEAGNKESGDYCEGDDWRPLPTINTQLLSSQ